MKALNKFLIVKPIEEKLQTEKGLSIGKRIHYEVIKSDTELISVGSKLLVQNLVPLHYMENYEDLYAIKEEDVIAVL